MTEWIAAHEAVECAVEELEEAPEEPEASPPPRTFADVVRRNRGKLPAWQAFFGANQARVDKISKKLAQETATFYPPLTDVLAALEATAPDEVRVVIVGQDPYHTAGQATGFAFATHGRPQPSLDNIYTELRSDGFAVSDPDSGDLSPWVRQGVLLINTALTVRASAAKSHEKFWKSFTENLFTWLALHTDRIVVVMWGRQAQGHRNRFVRHKAVESAHPSPLSAGSGFFGSRPFSRVNRLLEEMGRDRIDWSL